MPHKLDLEARMTIRQLKRRGWTQSAIARTLGVTEGTVRYHVGRDARGATDAALRRGESVSVKLSSANVVGGMTRLTGRRPGSKSKRGSLWFHTGHAPAAGTAPARVLLWTIEHGGRIESRQARTVLRTSRVHASGVLSQLRAAGMLRRDHWGRYSVTTKGKAARASLMDVGLYRKGTHRQRLADWARKRRRPFELADGARLLGISHASVHVVLRRLMRDRVVVRESLGVYRAR